MKILAINGSHRGKGNTHYLLEKGFEQAKSDIDFEIINLSEYDFSGCTGCEGCSKTMKCLIKDDMQKLYPKIEEADGLVLASPTYFYNISAKMKAFIERLYPYEVFDPNDRHIWLSAGEAYGIKYASVIGVCEQLDEKDMGFTIEAMALPLESLGYRVVSSAKVLNVFKPSDAIEKQDASIIVKRAVEALIKTIALKEKLIKS